MASKDPIPPKTPPKDETKEEDDRNAARPGAVKGGKPRPPKPFDDWASI